MRLFVVLLLVFLFLCVYQYRGSPAERFKCRKRVDGDGRDDGGVRRECPFKCGDEASLSAVYAFESKMKDSFNGISMLETMFRDKPGGGVWLQIGANTLDPTLNFNDPVMNLMPGIPHWSKYFVEPIPMLYDQLKDNIKKWPFSFAINAAVGVNRAKAGVVEHLPMYCLKRAVMDKDFHLKENLYHWANQICSFDRAHVLGHFPNNETVEISVTTLSPALLMRTHNISSVDALLIDTEGFDYKVLRNFPFTKIRPRVVIYEYTHLRDDLTASEQFMRAHCYALFRWHANIFAWAM